MNKRERLVQDVIDHLEKRNEAAITVEEYVERTQQEHNWKKTDIIVLYKAVRETKELFLDYVPVKKGEQWVPCIRVSRLTQDKEG